jgi:uncharacterized protein (DUF2147 family)
MLIQRKIHALRQVVVAGLCLALPVPAFAAKPTPVGLWKILDDKTGRLSALLRVSEHNDQYEGKLETIFSEPGDDPNPLCEKCEGDRKDHPLVGLIILWGFKKQEGNYAGGQVLDPDTGKIYSCEMSMTEDGKKLKVRGYLGIPLFGSTQIWVRAE